MHTNLTIVIALMGLLVVILGIANQISLLVYLGFILVIIAMVMFITFGSSNVEIPTEKSVDAPPKEPERTPAHWNDL